mmetsp:Transcript_55632/g.65012  ORF Transcript_55632/g.65012 Transcript_55632/m.65012 type:complete len:152 (+) Transcript_55632:198-653(+)
MICSTHRISQHKQTLEIFQNYNLSKIVSYCHVMSRTRKELESGSIKNLADEQANTISIGCPNWQLIIANNEVLPTLSLQTKKNETSFPEMSEKNEVVNADSILSSRNTMTASRQSAEKYLKPKRPLSAYNFFFKYKRALTVGSDLLQKKFL